MPPLAGLVVSYNESNIRDVEALIIGPPGTPYAMGFYQVSVREVASQSWIKFG